jgi:hypothetical protein
VFLDKAKAFDTVWIDGLLYKRTILHFASYLIHTILSYPRGRTYEVSFRTAKSSHRGVQAGVGVAGTSPLYYSACMSMT